MKYFNTIIPVSLLTGIAGSVSGGSPADSTRFTMDQCVNSFSIGHIQKTAAGYQYWFVDKRMLDGRTLKMSVVAPHSATHAPHRHVEDEFYFVLEGKAEFYLNGETRQAEPYTRFYCPPGSEHGIRNAGDTELKYLVIKKYPNPSESAETRRSP